MFNFDFSKFHVGIFDSGLGGKHVSLQIEQRFPQIRVTTLSDQKNIPYGRKTPAQMLTCVRPFMAQFEALKVDLIVIACNTCFLNLESELRQLTDIPILGFEPALDLAAAASRTRSVAVCATGGALKSRRWQELKAVQPDDLKVTDIDCTDWVSLVETSRMTLGDLKKVIDQAVAVGADSLVLGCTHYHWLREALNGLIPSGYDLQFYEPTELVLDEMARVLID